MIDGKDPSHNQPTPPLAPPGFLLDQPLKVWRSPAGLWFLRSDAHQAGGMLLPGSNGHIWHLYVPCDGDLWAGILLGVAADLQAAAEKAIQAMPTINSQPT